jgi:lysophospholipase L1-like esterase
MRVLVFGDSITQGYWDTDGGWVDRIRKHFDTIQATDLQGNDEPTIFNLGISADNSQNILERIETETVARTRHGNLPAVVIQIGVNDSSTDNQPIDESVRVSIQDYESNLREIIKKVQPISSKIIFVGLSACDESRTTPVSWGDYHYTNEAIKRYESVMESISSEHNLPFIPLFDEFKKAVDEGKDFLPDGLHPNNEGHQFIADTVRPKLEELLND